MSSSSSIISAHSPSSFTVAEPYKNIYHRKVLTEKSIAKHGEFSDELAWHKSGENVLIWTSGITWGNYDYDSLIISNLLNDVKPHLAIPKNIGKSMTMRPPELVKKFGSAYSNRGQSFNKGFKSRQFGRKSF